MRSLIPVLARAFDGVTDVLRRPSKVLLLLGGSVLVTFAYLCTFYFSIEAFGGGLPFATVGAVFLVGSAVAQAAPTPGGLGAVEAALIGGLVAAGLDNTKSRLVRTSCSSRNGFASGSVARFSRPRRNCHAARRKESKP